MWDFVAELAARHTSCSVKISTTTDQTVVRSQLPDGKSPLERHRDLLDLALGHGGRQAPESAGTDQHPGVEELMEQRLCPHPALGVEVPVVSEWLRRGDEPEEGGVTGHLA